VRRFDRLRLLGEGSVVHRRLGVDESPGVESLLHAGSCSLSYVYVNVNQWRTKRTLHGLWKVSPRPRCRRPRTTTP
jgi:hypothetical protein